MNTESWYSRLSGRLKPDAPIVVMRGTPIGEKVKNLLIAYWRKKNGHGMFYPDDEFWDFRLLDFPKEFPADDLIQVKGFGMQCFRHVEYILKAADPALNRCWQTGADYRYDNPENWVSMTYPGKPVYELV